MAAFRRNQWPLSSECAHLTSLKGVSSMKLHRDIGVSQKTAWFMLQRIRKAWDDGNWPFGGPVEVDETFIGGRERNKHAKDKLRAGRPTIPAASRDVRRDGSGPSCHSQCRQAAFQVRR